jgi:hypothetical protein
MPKFRAQPPQQCTLENLREAVRCLEQGDIGLREASGYYGIPSETPSRRWKPVNLVEKNVGTSGMSSFIMWKAFILITPCICLFVLLSGMFEAEIVQKKLLTSKNHQRWDSLEIGELSVL